ncbi:alkaline phosphatase D [Streptomyces sp. SAI-135]|uniref:alkaline phosphatase D family protein n=1 Tax=unclassified Streptomyces TaxID=2593676 RepID=UPI002475E3BF|nr:MULTISPECIES: alkaline phosphatase D family protein [unclassified Streptomyces]MDH6519367.1 alkaline phosphatase D [Streptomyces sp. SAI-090]MDH6570671.1 alkaline phosphatase D [Streptomyces sp. SAI-117]MDH6616541.1 alkaline phosphatase D [Streptomyces sp. SAI-135]
MASRHHPELRAAARHLGRRRFLTVTAAAAALAFGTHLPARGAAGSRELDAARIDSDPFTLGVASGDPLPDSVLLWTRLAPAPFEPDGGLPQQYVTVQWELASDETFAAPVRSGAAIAYPEYHHTLHVDVDGLEPDRVYYYRFRTGTWISATGRTRTAPLTTAAAASLSYAAVSCQAYFDGYYTAHRHLSQDDVDVVLHLGDYLYEYAVNSVGGHRAYTDRKLPALFNREAMTLEDYRLRYALYKSDPDLRAVHAAHPFVVTWDDHETENNYAGAVSENDDPPEEFLLRRAAAYRAYWENQPLRAAQLPNGPDARLYRRLQWGTLAQIDVLDTRQYRSDQVYASTKHTGGPLQDDPARTMTGAEQESWLIDGWRTSQALWNVLSQQVCFSQRKLDLTAEPQMSMDAWDGYRASRRRVLDGAKSAGAENLVVMTGDLHAGYAFDIKDDFDDPASRTLGTEFAATSVASGRDGAERPATWDTYLKANPHLKFYDGRRGYVRVTLDRQKARADFRTVSAVTTPGAPISTAASFVTEAGVPGLEPV